ncbi:hypothetical protein HBH82_231400 [Parastagonospora nodorum]|nr:hypothetical protein HBH82_231400 [Parastagonospora nodorum]KAH4661449.1 hypothetical protein HBH78_223430 [Parastagonospora nodorum]KAH4691702.1 hypothetical protein HBH67_239640 [Parastagonospora nodorum]KAH4755684.1 hypothetical protein HBH63_230090 [Parastagonospora nodorum]KAH4769815.1 hypothetical protein HBH62_228870 [Parastagonospora nodorum]
MSATSRSWSPKRSFTAVNSSSWIARAAGHQHPPLLRIDQPSDHEQGSNADQQYNGGKEMHDPPPIGTGHDNMPAKPAPYSSTGEVNGVEARSLTDAGQTAVQSDPKKRKRQFAHRTKTGCRTCRRRKKKCDERRPACSNCTNNNLLCEGYASKVSWQEKHARKPPSPLQAREQRAHEPTEVHHGYSGRNQASIPHCASTHSNDQLFPDSRVADPLVVEEHKYRSPMPTSWSEPARVSDFRCSAPVPAQCSQSSMPILDRTLSHRYVVSASLVPPPRTSIGQVYDYTFPRISATTNHTLAAADSPRQTPQQLPQTQTVQPIFTPQPYYLPQSQVHKTEREKMLNGEPFLQHDEQLTKERAHCTAAVYTFNNTASASGDLARGHLERNFWRIVSATWMRPHYTYRRPDVHGDDHFGSSVNVATPFYCDYGYNISVGDNVTIGSSCKLLDSAKIIIGRNTRIGASVIISTLKTPTDTKSLKGSCGTEIAQRVSVGENVCIGDGVTIEAGVRIGNDAIILAGSVVVGDIKDGVTARGNPAFG